MIWNRVRMPKVRQMKLCTPLWVTSTCQKRCVRRSVLIAIWIYFEENTRRSNDALRNMRGVSDDHYILWERSGMKEDVVTRMKKTPMLWWLRLFGHIEKIHVRTITTQIYRVNMEGLVRTRLRMSLRKTRSKVQRKLGGIHGWRTLSNKVTYLGN